MWIRVHHLWIGLFCVQSIIRVMFVFVCYAKHMQQSVSINVALVDGSLLFRHDSITEHPTSECSPSCLWGQFVQPVSIPRVICILHTCATFIPNRSSRLTTFPSILNCWSHKPHKMPPWGIVGRIVFRLCPFPDESTDVYQIWWQLPKTFKFVTPNSPRHAPWGIEGRLVFICPFPDESADVNQSWCQSV